MRSYGINGNGEFQGGGGGNQSAIGNYAANGTRTDALDITIDGAPGADPGCNCATSVNPNTEIVQEFKVLQSNFGAEHAKGPVTMSVVSKSGGRDFHGSAFYYLRDYHLNSNEWYANKVGQPRVQNKFIYPGFTLSGPTHLRRLQQEPRQGCSSSSASSTSGSAWTPASSSPGCPPQAMRNGDFSRTRPTSAAAPA